MNVPAFLLYKFIFQIGICIISVCMSSCIFAYVSFSVCACVCVGAHMDSISIHTVLEDEIKE